MRTTGRKGQATVELLTLYSVLFVPLVIASVYAYSAISDAMQFNQGISTLTKLANKAEELYAQGPGATTEIYIDVPNGVDWTQSFIGTDNSCPGPYFALQVRGSSAYRVFDGRAVGWWPGHSGLTKMKMKAAASGIISVAPSSWPYHTLTDYDWALASVEKGETYARFANRAFDVQGFLDAAIVTSASGGPVPAAGTFRIDSTTNVSYASLLCANENSLDSIPVRCYVQLFAYDGASWSLLGTGGEAGAASLAPGIGRATSTEFAAFPAGTTKVAVRFVAYDGNAGTSAYIQKEAEPFAAFFTVFNGGISQASACGAPADYCCTSKEACSGSPGSALNDYRQRGIYGTGSSATCHLGTW